MSEQTNPLWNHFIRAVQEEVKPALGCTEPISLALAWTQLTDAAVLLRRQMNWGAFHLR